MYLCICKAVSERAARRAIQQDGVVSLRDLTRTTGLGTCCGKCVPTAREFLQQELADNAAGAAACASTMGSYAQVAMG
ncbi:MAG: (2Fe-2S)-binding protein [Pseudomonadota bacterium]|nr:(2Fe-2S)-binding protein [Pseudomonadota bacterium]